MSLRAERFDVDRELAEISSSPDKKEKASYFRVSPTDFDMLESVSPELVTHEQAAAQMRGIVGHWISERVGVYVREERQEKNENLKTIGLVADHVRTELPSWMDQHLFYKQKGRKDSNIWVDGNEVSAQFAKEYWYSDKMNKFTDDVFAAEQKQINEYIAARQAGFLPPYPLLIQTDPNVESMNEELFINNVDFGFAQLQIPGKRDSATFDGEIYTVIDRKYGASEPNVMQAFLYSLLIEDDFKQYRKQPEADRRKPQKISIKNPQKITNVNFYYQILERNRQQYHYLLSNVHISSDIWSYFYEKVKIYNSRKDEMKSIKNLRKKAFVTPFIPEKDIQKDDVARRQSHLIYLSED